MEMGENKYRSLLISNYFLFGSIGVGTQGLMFARQVLYHLNHSANPYFQIFAQGA
jgi:hypothetical protein